MYRYFILAIGFSLMTGCVSAEQKEAAPTTAVASAAKPGLFAAAGDKLDKYWYQGQGELNVYDLQQNRYQGIHPGQVMLVFVTEDFLADKQVKNDNYKQPNSTPVLKLNAISRFTTGLYDYSLMTSVFTPVKNSGFGHTLKLTHTAQDWCGQTFSQINLRKGQYHHQLHSYFEDEADQENTIPAALLEDEIFNRIRMNWQALPQGSIAVVPSMNFLRLRHKAFKAYPATLTMADYSGSDFKGENLKVYSVRYPELNRQLDIVFNAAPPYLIEGWKDTYPSAFDNQVRSTIAKRTSTVLETYWSQNANTPENQTKRKDLMAPLR